MLLPVAVVIAASLPAATALPEAARIIRTCVPLLPGGPTTCTVGNPEEECSLSRLAAGNTNRLYCLTRAVTGDRYLVREFGTSSALRFDRDAENAVFAQLSERGLAPALIATFPGGGAGGAGGRIEGWLEGGPVTVEACRTPAVYEKVAEALAELHAFEPTTDGVGAQAWAWRAVDYYSNPSPSPSPSPNLNLDLNPDPNPKVEAWLPAAIERQRALGGRGLHGGGEYAERVAALRLSEASGRLEALRDQLEALPRCYCHNDLSNTNLHLDPLSGELRLIDFEYGGTNYRGFDLATHLSHWAGGASDGRYTDAAFPRGAALRGFLAAYAAHAPGSVTPDALADEVRLATPLVHAVWGLWAVCSLPEGGETRPFSHIEYAERRLAAFETSLLRSASSS